MVRSYRTVSPLPVAGHRAQPIGGLLSAALSVASRRLVASQLPALWSPDLPRIAPFVRLRTLRTAEAAQSAATRPTHRRLECYLCLL